MPKKVIALLFSVISTYIAAVILVSQLNISRVEDLGFSIPVGQRIAAVVRDLIGMLSTYLPLIGVALLIAFLFTSLILMRFLNKPVIWFPLAGFVGLITIHLTLNTVFGVAGIAPTRTMLGLFSQGLAGTLGGYIFYHMVYSRRSRNWNEIMRLKKLKKSW
jgi:hypothetical protein